jgi:hypothetical protein
MEYPFFNKRLNFLSILLARLVAGLGLFFFGLFFLRVKKTLTTLNIYNYTRFFQM